MDPHVPEWRTLSAGPEPSAGSVVHSRSTVVRPVVPLPLVAGAVLVVAGLLAAVAAGVLALAPEPRPVLVESAADATRAGLIQPGGIVDALGGATVAAPLVVDVAGAVARPGIVRVPPGSRVGDAIRLAGGYGPRADLAAAASRLNLAEPLSDGAKVLVPELGDGSIDPVADPGRQTGGLVDLNTASQAELEELPGIGPVTATKIIEARSEQAFHSVDELRGRELLGQATFDKVRELVTAGR
jgi:competence protein ComEA